MAKTEELQEKLVAVNRVANRISSFVLPLGATVNMNGTALYQGVATVFLAQVFDVPLSVFGLLLVVVTAVSASIGSPATPGAGIVIQGEMAAALHCSPRSLQRKLREEGTSFQVLLDETRSDLSHHYLKKPELSVVEISYLLGFRDPGSFYRAFQGWTGQTPADVRSRLLN